MTRFRMLSAYSRSNAPLGVIPPEARPGALVLVVEPVESCVDSVTFLLQATEGMSGYGQNAGALLRVEVSAPTDRKLRTARKRRKPDDIMIGALCVSCGPQQRVDEDGCCLQCGSNAMGPWADKALRALKRVLPGRSK